MRKINRIVDANINRLKEGLRTAEDILRFYFDRPSLWKALRDLRHKASLLSIQVWGRGELLKARDTKKDKGKIIPEGARRDLKDILYTAFQRSKESLRVLEELSKLTDIKKSAIFKKLRFKLYSLEKKVILDIDK